LKDAARLAAYFAATILIGALLAPFLFWTGQALATHSLFSFLATSDFERFFHRALLIAAVALLWPFLRLGNVRSMTDLRLAPNPCWSRDVFLGSLLSAIPLLCCGALLIALNVYAFQHNVAWARFGNVLAASIAVPLIEETFFRGIVLGILLRTGRQYMSIFATSAIFSVLHFLKAPERTSTIVTWTSGLKSVAHAFEQFSDPTMLLSAFATLFPHWLDSCRRAYAHSLVVVANWTACRMDFFERRVQSRRASRNSCASLVGKKPPRGYCALWHSWLDMGDNENLDKI
jgi:membrane protease YdiL (CAAX protease family)